LLNVKKSKINVRISWAFFCSICIHVLIPIIYFESIKKLEKEQIVKSNQINKFKKIQLKEIKFISKKDFENLKKQLVTTEKNKKNEKPLESRFQSETNQSLDRQTIAKVIDKFNSAGKGEVSNFAKAIAKKSSEFSSDVKNQLKAKFHKISLDDLNALSVEKLVKDKNELEKKHIEEVNLGLKNGKEGNIGLASNNDYIDDIPLGDVTNLNTTENKYYGFYQRIKKQLEQHWGSTIKDRARKLYKGGRRIPASETLITDISVVIDEKGSIVEISIKGTSGVRELDQAAIESFNKAGPFPNPPKGLLVDGRAVIQWGFVVKS
jgi:TonB family protein